MQFSTVFATALVSGLALAAPSTKRAEVKSMAAQGTWTIERFIRTCQPDDSSCDIQFGVNRNDGSAVTSCNYIAQGPTASHAQVDGIKCGAYTISSAWNSQGFTVWAVTDGTLIAFPSYSDTDLVNDQVVTPDRAFNVQNVA